jgi:Cdc6-like AAA superfamily ATPase
VPLEFGVNFRGLSSRGFGGGRRQLNFPFRPAPRAGHHRFTTERAAGVTVQGPPGTGKTHTIANIICHYLTDAAYCHLERRPCLMCCSQNPINP